MRILTVLLCFVSLLVVAEEQAYEVPVKKDDLEEARFKNEMEARLARDIKSYLGDNRFIIQVEATLQKTRTMVKSNEPASPGSALPKPPVRQPVAEIRPRTIKTFDDNELEALPGLPVNELPLLKENEQEIQALQNKVQQLERERTDVLNYADQLKQEAETKIQTIREKTLGFRNSIKKMTITLVVDRTLNDEQVEFLRNLITRKSQLDELRGDTLNIVRTEFKRLENEKPVVLSIWDEYALWFWLASLLLVLLVIGFGMRALGRRMIPAVSAPLTASSDTGYSDNRAVVAQENDQQVELKRQVNEVRQALVSSGLSQPQLFQQLVQQGLQRQQYSEAAAMLEVMGKPLLRSLVPALTGTEWQELEQQRSETDWSNEMLLQSLSAFQQRLQQGLADNSAGNSPFSFLEKLNDSQVLYLIKDEDTRIKALVMSQLPAERAADIIQRMKEKDQAAVAYELGQFDTLPVSAFRDVADRLAQASLSVPTFENISADGLSVLIRMLDNMNSAEETRLLKTLKGEKPETYYRLRQVYFTFADMARAPERVLANELRDIDRGVLAAALCHTSTEFKRHVLAALPAKLRAAVIAELKTTEADIAQETVEAGRKQVVQKMRDVLKAGRFSMEELAPIAKQSQGQE
ncbi:FliG C-terminal domain-containing protein [Thalassolituus hydrocarboniclasticus]|uniref:Flagellar motor switch protein FliG n=1 Tax=Thalassolituus hydrocarboniclasticus TaxID=2742796 RepID=A0ABY6AFB6_9GAMM|nr:FliG C-terminal domain-containing protein [Thalassolituus hydrocarboniclasticus]UXD88553.1 hypothetical protein HUF19_14435 [Thalassolituus hydrocarboniclasticus]